MSDRMSLSRALELALSRGGGERSSVALTRNAKGQTQIDVVVRTDDAGSVHTAEDAAARAQAIYDELDGRYPYIEPSSPAK